MGEGLSRRCILSVALSGSKVRQLYTLVSRARVAQDSRQADTDVEITPAMIEAGVNALVDWEDSSNPHAADCVRSICIAVEKVRRSGFQAS